MYMEYKVKHKNVPVWSISSLNSHTLALLIIWSSDKASHVVILHKQYCGIIIGVAQIKDAQLQFQLPITVQSNIYLRDRLNNGYY